MAIKEAQILRGQIPVPSRNDISDARNPRPTVKTVYTGNLSSRKSDPEKKWNQPPAPGVAESVATRLRLFLNTKLDERGVCIRCGYRPFKSERTNLLRCYCKVPSNGGLFRHWENGVPCASAAEQELLEQYDG